MAPGAGLFDEFIPAQRAHRAHVTFSSPPSTFPSLHTSEVAQGATDFDSFIPGLQNLIEEKQRK